MIVNELKINEEKNKANGKAEKNRFEMTNKKNYKE